MARLIVKSPYIKCGTGQSAGGYLKYIATRERVEIIPDEEICEGFQMEADRVLYDYCIKAKELR